MTTLAHLQRWYLEQKPEGLKGNWVEIKTFDNPCWFVAIKLRGTSLDNKVFADVDEGVAEEAPWTRCYIEENTWKGFGDDLEQVLEQFMKWVEDNDGSDRS